MLPDRMGRFVTQDKLFEKILDVISEQHTVSYDRSRPDVTHYLIDGVTITIRVAASNAFCDWTTSDRKREKEQSKLHITVNSIYHFPQVIDTWDWDKFKRTIQRIIDGGIARAAKEKELTAHAERVDVIRKLFSLDDKSHVDLYAFGASGFKVIFRKSMTEDQAVGLVEAARTLGILKVE